MRPAGARSQDAAQELESLIKSGFPGGIMGFVYSIGRTVEDGPPEFTRGMFMFRVHVVSGSRCLSGFPLGSGLFRFR